MSDLKRFDEGAAGNLLAHLGHRRPPTALECGERALRPSHRYIFFAACLSFSPLFLTSPLICSRRPFRGEPVVAGRLAGGFLGPAGRTILLVVAHDSLLGSVVLLDLSGRPSREQG